MAEENTTDTKEDTGNLHKIFMHLTKWLGDSEKSTSETMFREESREDLQFYAGQQDTKEVLARLKELKRPPTVYNEIKPKIDMLIGLGAQMKLAANVVPTGDEDEAMAELMKNTIEHFKRKLDLNDREAKCFEKTVKSGRSFLHYWVDDSNPFKLQLRSAVVPGYRCYCDPDSEEYNMSDARYFFVDKWVDEEDIKELYPAFDGSAAKASYGDSVPDYPIFFNEAKEKYRLVDVWYRKYEKVIWFINPINGQPDSLKPKDFDKFAKALKKGIPVGSEPDVQMVQMDSLENQDGVKQFIYYAIFGGSGILKHQVSPYQGYLEKHFPYIKFGAYVDDENNRYFGAITMQKDPQRGINTMRRQLMHMLQTAPKGIMIHETGAIINIDDYEDRGNDPTYHMEVVRGAIERVKFTKQPTISPVYNQLDQVFVQSMKDASGVQDSMMGVQTFSREPGITTQMRQDASIAVLYILFSNYTKSRIHSTRILMALIQQYVTAEEVIRIQGESGYELMQINSQLNPQIQGFNDVTMGEYDLIVDEDAETRSTRLAIAKMLVDFSQNNPGMIPPDIILDYANLPFTVKQEIKAFNQAALAEETRRWEKEMEIKMKQATKTPTQGGSKDGS